MATHRQALAAVADEHVAAPVGGDHEAVIAAKVPGDPRRPDVPGEAQVDDLLLDRLGHPQGVVLRAWSPVHEAGLTALLVGMQPVVLAMRRDPAVPAGLGDVASRLRALEHGELALAVPLLLSHSHDLSADEEHWLCRRERRELQKASLIHISVQVLDCKLRRLQCRQAACTWSAWSPVGGSP